jgi:hypothetical protein
VEGPKAKFSPLLRKYLTMIAYFYSLVKYFLNIITDLAVGELINLR